MQIINKFKQLIKVYIFFISFVLFIIIFSTTYLNANIYKVSDIEISSPFELNFKKNLVIDQGFKISFINLLSMITTSGDRNKIKNISIKELKGMIDSFTISDEKFINNEYFAKLETTFNKKKILNFLERKSIFPSVPIRNKVLLVPILVDTETNSIYLFNNNIFYKRWNDINKNYQLLRRIKKTFDPNNVFNKGKITDAFPMDKNLRYEIDRKEPEIKTIQDFSDSEGILKLAEKCNGSGDCRKPVSAGGTMCPSYRATKNEKDTTRARANMLREVLTNNDAKNKFDSTELKEVFDLCLSCKACATECPSNVDIATMKAEFLHQYQEANGYSFRSKLFANNVKYNKLGSISPFLTNSILGTSAAKKIMGIASQRSIPKLAKKTLRSWFYKNYRSENNRKIFLFCDEFTNFYDVEIGKDTIVLLEKLGYKVEIINHEESGRSFISKGFLKEAKQVCNRNIDIFKDVITNESPLIGIEPSAILTFRDEYLRLADDKISAEKIAKNTFTIEEFLASENKKENIDTSLFSSEEKEIKIHGHCHQKAFSGTLPTFSILNIPSNYNVAILNTGCCGMAGSFGYEKEHYDLSMQVGEDTLFPKVRNCSSETEIAAAGTSCRHQIFDGTKRIAKHPITILKEALI